MGDDFPLENDGIFHPQTTVWIGERSSAHIPDEFQVDAGIARVIELIRHLDIPTYGSCQNYGEYLRKIGFDHIHESKRDYAYIEFYEFDDALAFVGEVENRAGVANMLYHQIKHEGTPGAWELKYRWSTGQFWVWLPATDIPEIERVLGAEI